MKSGTWLRMVALAALATPLLSGCAWVDRAKRPVWNAFEENLVPEEGGWFYAALPLTIPAGFTAAVVDAFISQPVMSFDDALDDAAKVWEFDDDAFTDAYYTESLLVPVRVVGTPVVFAGSWLARSLFRIPEPMTEKELHAQQEAWVTDLRGQVGYWLDILKDQPGLEHGAPPSVHPDVWTPELTARAVALQGPENPPLVRLAIYGLELRNPGAFPDIHPELGLQDPDPAFRHALVLLWPSSLGISERVFKALESDPSPMVRAQVKQQRLRIAR